MVHMDPQICMKAYPSWQAFWLEIIDPHQQKSAKMIHAYLDGY